METLRPKYHITAKENWINDPNGSIKYKGQYHVFMQHHPFGLTWGPMHWYHVSSEDLIHWKHLPIALYPGDEFDKDGCFSGSSIIVGERLYVVYTGYIYDEDPEKIIQQQCLAYSDDGINFVKLGCIIDKSKLPDGYASNDFRDPKILKENDTYYLLVAARKLDGRGRILLYKSQDILNWEFVSDIFDIDSRGKMIECPDFIKDLDLLIYCEQEQPVDGYMHHNFNSTYYKFGKFVNHQFISRSSGTLDYGFDFYAPQVFANENVLIAWMDMWGRNQPSEPYDFAGQLTIPRRIDVINDVLVQTPVFPENIEKEVDVKNEYSEHVTHGFYELDIDNLESLTVVMRKGEFHHTTFSLSNGEWVFDRSLSGKVITGGETDEDSLKGIRRMPYIKKNHHKIWIVLDEFSVEIFVDGTPMTSSIFPEQKDDLFQIFVQCDNCHLRKHN